MMLLYATCGGVGGFVGIVVAQLFLGQKFRELREQAKEDARTIRLLAEPTEAERWADQHGLCAECGRPRDPRENGPT